MHSTPTMKLVRGLLVLALLATATLSAQKSLTVHPFFGSHMVLPRDTTIRLRGQAPTRAVVEIRVSWLDETYQGMGNDTRDWEITLPTPPAGGPHRIEIRAAGERIDLENIAAGDVWLASGQSNMEWLLRDSKPDLQRARAIEEMRDAGEELSLVRYLNVARRAAARPQSRFRGAWRDVDVKLLPKVSAVGYFFARSVADKTGVPIGIISSNWGGTPAHAWTSAATLRELGILTDRLHAIDEARKNFDDSSAGFARRLKSHRTALRASDPGFSRGWTDKVDDRDWPQRSNLSTWTEPALATFDGSVWFRSSFELPQGATRSGHIEFGPIDDQDLVFVNGRQVGGREEGSGWNQPRRYPLPAGLLREGANRVVVRVTDTGGAGGVSGKPDLNRVVLDGGRVLPLDQPWRWRKGKAMRDLPAPPKRQLCGPHDPASLFRGMIRPFRVYPIKGVIWYQGESDVARADQYRSLFPAMIKDWRKLLANDDLSFYFVQIAPFNYRAGLDSAALRLAQEAALELPRTGMAVTLDVGNPRDIHPRKKAVVGQRLAAFALTRDYGLNDLRPEAPRFREAKRTKAGLVLSFDHAEGGLVAPKGIEGFELSRDGKTFAPASARLDKGRIVLAIPPEATGPLSFRYAWSNTPRPTIFGTNGLPLPSFRGTTR